LMKSLATMVVAISARKELSAAQEMMSATKLNKKKKRRKKGKSTQLNFQREKREMLMLKKQVMQKISKLR